MTNPHKPSLVRTDADYLAGQLRTQRMVLRALIRSLHPSTTEALRAALDDRLAAAVAAGVPAAFAAGAGDEAREVFRQDEP